jgi:hypothetical protein
MKYIFLILLVLMLPIVYSDKIVYRVTVVQGRDYDSGSFFNSTNKVYVQTVDKKTELNIGDLICFNTNYKIFKGTGYNFNCLKINLINKQKYTLITKDKKIIEEYPIQRKDIAFKVVKIE